VVSARRSFKRISFSRKLHFSLTLGKLHLRHISKQPYEGNFSRCDLRTRFRHRPIPSEGINLDSRIFPELPRLNTDSSRGPNLTRSKARFRVSLRHGVIAPPRDCLARARARAQDQRTLRMACSNGTSVHQEQMINYSVG